MMNIRIFYIIVFIFISFLSSCQNQNLVQKKDIIPFLSEPNILLDKNGVVIAKFPANYNIINSDQGDSNKRRSNSSKSYNNLGTCGYILAKDFDTGEIAMFDFRANKIHSFGNKYQKITPCKDGFHIAKLKIKSKYGTAYNYLDSLGNTAFNNMGFTNAKEFNEGLAAVSIPSQGWGYINKYGTYLSIIPKKIEKIKNVSSFYNGLSMIQSYKGKNGYTNVYNGFFINQKGQIVIDVQKLFPNRDLKHLSSFRGGTALLEFMTVDKTDSDLETDKYFINTKGEIISVASNIDGFSPGKSSYVCYNENISNGLRKVHINDSNGNSLKIPEINGILPENVNAINDHYFILHYPNQKESLGSYVFDASIQEVIFNSKDYVLAVEDDLISVANINSNKYYVLNYKTKETIYYSNISEVEVQDLSGLEKEYKKIKKYVCSKEEDFDKLPYLKNVEELTIRNVNTQKLPNLKSLEKLKILRIDNCRYLTEFPDYLTNLNQLSLSSCPSAQNLMSMIDNQKKLKSLFIINFDLPANYKSKLKAKYPTAIISGKAADIDNEIQEVFEGF